MTNISKTTVDHLYTAGIQPSERQISNVALKVGRFILHFLEMALAMMAGMVILYLLDILLIPESSSFNAFVEYGTIQFDFAMVVFMAVPMVAWMLLRGHARRHVAEMAFGMNVPAAAIIVLRLLGEDAYLPWLAYSSHPGMFLGMIIMMFYRRDHYTVKAGHSAHATHNEIS